MRDIRENSEFSEIVDRKFALFLAMNPVVDVEKSKDILIESGDFSEEEMVYLFKNRINPKVKRVATKKQCELVF